VKPGNVVIVGEAIDAGTDARERARVTAGFEQDDAPARFR
jgi:hypothetical protein